MMKKGRDFGLFSSFIILHSTFLHLRLLTYPEIADLITGVMNPTIQLGLTLALPGQGISRAS